LKAKPKQPLFSETLRAAIRESGLSSYALGQLAGVSRSILCAFLDRKRGLTSESIDKIAPHIGLKASYPKRADPR
jgi:antitoxin component HigA of HigAB toxin-antitoxin module